MFILILSLGLISASSNPEGLNDMNYPDNGEVICDSLDSNLDNSLDSNLDNNLDSNLDNSLDSNLDSNLDNSLDSNLDNSLESGDDLSVEDLKNNDLSIENNLNEDPSSGGSFSDIQALIDETEENGTITLGGIYVGDSKIIINKTLNLEGNRDGATLDGQFLTQILEVSAPNINLSNIRFVNSYSISVNLLNDNITIRNCSFENSINGELGSALVCNGDNLKISNSSFSNNIANKSSCHHTNGAAIYLIGNNALIENCSFINNTGYNFETASSGGAIWLKGYSCSIINSIFINNSASAKFAWTLHSEEQTYLAEGYGGAIYWMGNNGKIDNCSFINCVSHAFGGAIYFKSVNKFLINNTNFLNNYAVGDAGAIYLGQNIFNFNINNSKFEENVALGLQGVISQYDAYGGAIFAGKWVENLSVSNSSFLNNYGNASIYYLGSDLQVSNSIFDQSESVIGNATLEKFLSVIKDSTLEECILNITNFKLYSASGLFYEAVIYTNGSLNSNYWGSNINSSDEFKAMKLIKSGEEYSAPDYWANLGIAGLNVLTKEGIYEYKFRFVLNDDSDIELKMPDYALKLENNIESNLNYSKIVLKDNYAKVDYKFIEKGIDNLKVKNAYGKLLNSITINCGNVSEDYGRNNSNKIAKEKSLIVSKDMTTTTVYKADGKVGKYFRIRLTDSNSKALANKQIKITFNGKNYYRTTDSNGYVKFQINLVKKGTYTIAARFLGDDKYDATFKSYKVKVNPVKPKLKAANKKYKLSAKKKTLTAKLLSPKGKAVKGKKISFRINGKTYTAKTNSKGIATVKVKLNKRKTYKFTAKFAGDKTFKAISVKRKVVVI